jgi:hypothetical protein
MSWLKWVVDKAKSIFTQQNAHRILESIRKAAPYADHALEIAQVGASFCGPTGRTVGAILSFAERVGVHPLIAAGASDRELALAMRDIAVEALKKKYPNAANSDLNRAVEIAVGALKP